MHQSDSILDSSRLDEITTIGKKLIKEPVREAVQEAFEEERQQRRSESQTATETSEDTRQSGSRRRQVLITVGLIAIGVLLFRRTQLQEAMPFGNESTTDDPATMSGEKTDFSTSSETRVETGHESSTDSQ